MSLYDSILALWKVTQAVNQYVPVENVWTGRVDGLSPPYATLNTEGDFRVGGTSKAEDLEQTLKIQVWAERHDHARLCLVEICNMLRDQPLQIDDGMFISLTYQEGNSEKPGPTGTAFGLFTIQKRRSRR